MGWMRRLLNSGPRQARVERDLVDEVTFHRDQYALDLEAQGLAPDVARREAQRRVGLTGTWVAEGLAQDTLPWVSTWLRETTQALRGLRRRPWLTVTAVLTLAGGAGVLLAAFTIVDRVLLAPLPFPEADRLVVLEEAFQGESTGGNPARTADWGRALQGTMTAVAGFYGEQLVMTRGDDAQRVLAWRGVGPFVDVLRLTTARGRTFSPDEQRDGAAVAMLTDRGWQRLFSRDPRVLDVPVTLRGAPYRIVGVLPPDLDHPSDVDLVAPAGPGYQRAGRGGNWLQVVGRLEPEVTLARAQAAASAGARRLTELHPETDAGLSVRLTPLQAFETRDVRTPVLLLLAAACTVYLVVCVNVGGLLLVRALTRDQELAVRMALGAGRWAMVRLTLHEALALTMIAVALAWLVAQLVLRWLASAVVTELARLDAAAIGLRTGAAALAIVAVTVLLLAVWPAWHVITRSARQHAASHAVTDAPSRRRVRRVLVATQVACSTMLVVLALLFAGSLRSMLAGPRGFTSDRVLAVRYDLDWEQPKAEIDGLARRVQELAMQVPGVEVVGLVDRFPLQGGTQSARVQLFGEPVPPANRPDVSVRSATPEYFAAVGIPFLHGRPFVDDPADPGRREVVVSAAFARTHFGTLDVVGRRLAVLWEPGAPTWLEVTGVVGDVRQTLRDTAPVPEIYRPWSQAFWPLLHIGVRTSGAPDVLPRLRAHLLRSIPDHPLASALPLDEALAEPSRQPRTLARVMTTCAGAAAVLAMIGLYGLLASEMIARRREIGIRLALGARSWRLRGDLLRPGLGLLVVGIGLGLALSIPAARALETQWFGVASGDVTSRVAAAVLIAGAALVAITVPAWRLVGPRALAALRYE